MIFISILRKLIYLYISNNYVKYNLCKIFDKDIYFIDILYNIKYNKI